MKKIVALLLSLCLVLGAASAMAAARLKRETATAALRTAAHTALAPFAAERTSIPIILFLRAGTGALTRT